MHTDDTDSTDFPDRIFGRKIRRIIRFLINVNIKIYLQVRNSVLKISSVIFVSVQLNAQYIRFWHKIYI